MAAEHDLHRNVAALKASIVGQRRNAGHSMSDRLLGALSLVDRAIVVVTAVRKLASIFSKKNDGR